MHRTLYCIYSRWTYKE